MTVDLPETSRQLVRRLVPLFGVRFASVRRIAENGVLEVVLWEPNSPDIDPEPASGRGEGLEGHVVTTGGPVHSSDVTADDRCLLTPEARERIGRDETAARLGVPIRVAGVVAGVLTIGDRAPRQFSDADRAALEAVADHLALAVEHARLVHDVRRTRRETEVLTSLTRTINGSLDLAASVPLLVSAASELCGSDVAWLAIRDAVSGAMVVPPWLQTGPSARPAVITPGDGVPGQALLTGQPTRTLASSIGEPGPIDAHHAGPPRGRLTELAVPVRVGENLEGVLVAASHSGRLFTDHDEAALVRLAAHAAVAIATSQRLERERAAREAAAASAEALRRSEEHYRALVEGSIQGICIQHRFIILFANLALARMLGFESADDIVGLDLRTMLTPEYRGRLEALQAARDRGEPAPTRYEVEGIRRDGSRIWVEVLASPVQWGSFSATMGTMQDVTERHIAAEALRQSQRTLRTVIDAVPAMISAKDMALRFIFMNRLQAEVQGVTVDEAVGRTASELWGEAAAAAEALDREVLATGRPRPFYEEQRRDRHGEIRSWLTTKVPVHDADGRVGGVVTIAVDITERKRLEDDLRQAQKMEGVGRLAGGVAHDFNNLLTIIIGRAQLLLEHLPTDDVLRPGLEEIGHAAERGAALTHQLLAFSRRQVVQPTVLDVNDILAELEPMLRRLLDETIDLAIVPPAMPATVEADRGQLEQAVLNLVVNARDAMPQGGRLTLETATVNLAPRFLEQRGATATGPYVLLRVTDTGHGMVPETQEKIFEPFFTTKEVGKGTGLGLATVYGIVKQSGGFITVDSVVGRGTTFGLYFPRTARAVETKPAPRSTSEGARGEETVLVVEDAPEIRRLVCDVLAKAGYTVLEAARASEALELCARHPRRLDLLVTDIVMPVMSGRELAERVAVMRPDIRVLYMSGYNEDDIVRHGVRAGSMPLLHKPFRPAALVRAVRRVLDAPR